MKKNIVYLFFCFYFVCGCATINLLNISGEQQKNIKNEELICLDLTKDYQKTLNSEKIFKMLCLDLSEENQKALNYRTFTFTIEGLSEEKKSPENLLIQKFMLKFREEYKESLNNRKIPKISDDEERQLRKIIKELPEDYSNEIEVEPIVKDSEWVFMVNKNVYLLEKKYLGKKGYGLNISHFDIEQINENTWKFALGFSAERKSYNIFFLEKRENKIYIYNTSLEKGHKFWWYYPMIIFAFPICVTFDAATLPVQLPLMLLGSFM